MVDEAVIPEELAGPRRRSTPVPEDLDRLEALERQVRQLMTRLARWVESQLLQAVDDRRTDLRALRGELQAMLDEQTTNARAEGTSILTVAIRRLTTNQEELGERLDSLAGQASRSAEGMAAVVASVEDEAARVLAFEEQVRAAVAGLGESLDRRLTDAAAGRQLEMDRSQTELRALLEERIQATAAQALRMTEAVAEMSASIESEALRMEAFEDRARAAMAHHAESVDDRLAALVSGDKAELTRQLAEARSQIAAAVAGATKRFVRGQEQLGQRLDDLAGRVAGESGKSDGLADAITTDGRRIEALEQRVTALAAGVGDVSTSLAADRATLEGIEARVRRSEQRLDQLVEVQAATTGGVPVAELAAVTHELALVRSDMATASASQAEASARELGLLESDLKAVAGRVDDLATATAASSAEGGPLAPLRSDVRHLQSQVAALSDALGDVQSRRSPSPRPTGTARPSAPGRTPATKPARAAKRAPRATKNKD